MAGILDEVFPYQFAQESGWNPFAVSPKGAQGIAQVMPATAADPGFGIQPARYSSGKYNARDPNDVSENQRVGKDLMTYLYSDPKSPSYGNLEESLMGYNWGPGNLRKWIASGRNPALVPGETKDYVSKILGHLQGNSQPGTMPANLAQGPQGVGGVTNVAMNVPPPANTGSAMPNDVAPPAPTGGQNQGFDINSVLKDYAGQMGWKGSLGPSLLALAAGLASGGAPGGGGWGAGLAKGFSGVNEIQQTRLKNSLSLAELMQSLNAQNRYLDIASRGADVTPPDVTRGLGEASSIAPDDWTKALTIGAGGGGYSGKDWLTGKGPSGEARSILETAVQARRDMLGLPPLEGDALKQEYEKFIPSTVDLQDPATVASKYNKLFDGLRGAYKLASVNKSPEWHKQFDPMVQNLPQKVTPDMVKQWAKQQAATSQAAGQQQAGAGGTAPMMRRNPKTGQIAVLNPQTGQWEIQGGATSNAAMVKAPRPEWMQ